MITLQENYLDLTMLLRISIKGGKTMINWLKSRIEERTSWDGAALILMGVIVLIAGPFAKIAAYAAIAYGAWTIYKKEG